MNVLKGHVQIVGNAEQTNNQGDGGEDGPRKYFIKYLPGLALSKKNCFRPLRELNRGELTRLLRPQTMNPKY